MKPDIIIGAAHWSPEDQTWGWHEFRKVEGYRPRRHQCAAAFSDASHANSVRAVAVKRHMSSGLVVRVGPTTRWYCDPSPMPKV